MQEYSTSSMFLLGLQFHQPLTMLNADLKNSRKLINCNYFSNNTNIIFNATDGYSFQTQSNVNFDLGKGFVSSDFIIKPTKPNLNPNLNPKPNSSPNRNSNPDLELYCNNQNKNFQNRVTSLEYLFI